MYGIDLRPREFVRQKEFFLPRVFFATGVIIYLLVLITLGLTLRFFQQEKSLKVTAAEEEYSLALMVNREKEENLNALEELRQLNEEREESGLSQQLEQFLHTLFMISGQNSGNTLQIQAVKSEKNGRLSVTASAEEQVKVLKFLLQLRDSEGFKVTDYSQQGMEEGRRFIFVFEIEFDDKGS